MVRPDRKFNSSGVVAHCAYNFHGRYHGYWISMLPALTTINISEKIGFVYVIDDGVVKIQ